MHIEGRAETKIDEEEQVQVCCAIIDAVSYTHLRAHETVLDLVCRLLLEKKKSKQYEGHTSIWAATTTTPQHAIHKDAT